MPEQINLIELFTAASKAIGQHQEQLNQADKGNKNHGDNMVQVMEVITQAMKEKKNSDAPTQLEYAAELLRKKSNSGSASLLSDGLAKAAEQVTGKKIDIGSALSLLQTVMNGGKGQPRSSGTGDLLGTLLTGLTGGNTQKADDGMDIGDMLNIGMGLLQSAKDSGLDVSMISRALVADTEMGKTDHRSQSGEIITNAVLQLVMENLNKK
jgi:hypothetical protein